MEETLVEMAVKRHNAIVTARKERRKAITHKQAKSRGYNDRWKGASAFGNPYVANDYQAAWREGWNLADEEIAENQSLIEGL